MTRIAKLMCLDQLKETPTYSFVRLNPEPRECGRCKQKYIPNNNDISLIVQVYIGTNAQIVVNICKKKK